MELLVKIVVSIILFAGFVFYGFVFYKMAKRIDWNNLADSVMNRVEQWRRKRKTSHRSPTKARHLVTLGLLILVPFFWVRCQAESVAKSAADMNWTKIGFILLGLAILAGVIYFGYKMFNDGGTKKLWKFLRWPVGIVAGLVIIFFGAPWVWRNAGPAFDAFIAFGETPSRVSKEEAQIFEKYALRWNTTKMQTIVAPDTGTGFITPPPNTDVKWDRANNVAYRVLWKNAEGDTGSVIFPKDSTEHKTVPPFRSIKFFSLERELVEIICECR